MIEGGDTGEEAKKKSVRTKRIEPSSKTSLEAKLVEEMSKKKISS